MKEYKEFQFCWLLIWLMIPVEVLMTLVFIYTVGTRPLTIGSFLFTQAIMVTITLMFYGMSTTIDSKRITIRFGIGLIRKTIALNKVEKIDSVINPWLYGWGIRYIPNGMLYNVSGSEGIELNFNDTHKIIRIGTEDPARLKMEIEKWLGR